MGKRTKTDAEHLEDLLRATAKAGLDPDQVESAFHSLTAMRDLAMELSNAVTTFGPRPDRDSDMVRRMAEVLDRTDAAVNAFAEKTDLNWRAAPDVQIDLRRIADRMDALGWDDFSAGITSFQQSSRVQ